MGGERMKRRLALLLALTLTFATLSPAGAIAAEGHGAVFATIEDHALFEDRKTFKFLRLSAVSSPAANAGLAIHADIKPDVHRVKAAVERNGINGDIGP